MNPHILDQIAHQHVADLRRDASQAVAAGPAGGGGGRARGTGPGAGLRCRAGWALVHLGLRLAVRSADA